MLEDMKDARVVPGQGLEGDGEELIGVAVIDPRHARAAFYVLHFPERAGKLRMLASADDFEAVENVVDLHKEEATKKQRKTLRLLSLKMKR